MNVFILYIYVTFVTFLTNNNRKKYGMTDENNMIGRHDPELDENADFPKGKKVVYAGMAAEVRKSNSRTLFLKVTLKDGSVLSFRAPAKSSYLEVPSDNKQ